MDEKERRVPIPSYAKHGKKGSIYALEREVPYFQDEQNVKGYFVIGHECGEEGMMVPNWNYDLYCTEDAVEKKKKKALEEKRLKEEQEEEERREAEEREKNLGWTYISLSRCEDETGCYPINGYLAEKYFSESGITEILDDVLGKELSFWLRLSAALNATCDSCTFEYSDLFDYPMNNHMVFKMNRIFTLSMWSRITDEEADHIITEWLQKKPCSKVSAAEQQSLITLYHDKHTDSYGDWFFGQRVRTGTRYNASYMVYRNAETGELLAYERLKYSDDPLVEINTIHESSFPSLQKASLWFYMVGYINYAMKCLKKVPGMICMHTSEYENQKEMKKILMKLEKAEEKDNRKIIRWDGELNGLKGQWILLEIPGKRKWMTEDARRILQQHKLLLSAMSYLTASVDSWSCYFDIECQDEERYNSGFDDDVPFSVKLAKNASALFRQDAGRYLYFTTEEPLTDQQMIDLQWRQEDMFYQYNAFINQGETTDVTDDFFNAMAGRDLALFLAQSCREWIYAHVGDLFTEEYDIDEFARDISRFRCDIAKDGSVKAEQFDEKTAELMKRFGITRKDLVEYMQKHASEKSYFSDEYEEQ